MAKLPNTGNSGVNVHHIIDIPRVREQDESRASDLRKAVKTSAPAGIVLKTDNSCLTSISFSPDDDGTLRKIIEEMRTERSVR
jgi:hypothetical protein